MIDLTEKLLDKYPPKPNKIGRYSCSKIYAILQGWTTPEQYINGEEIDFTGAMNMTNGTWKHQVIQDILEDDYFMEYKKVKRITKGMLSEDGEYSEDFSFEIVGMADCIIWDEILEIKTSQKVHPKAKPWAAHQLKLYLTLFEIPKGRIVQPIISEGLKLKVLGEYKRNDTWFFSQMEKLAEFHKQLIKLTAEQVV